MTRSPLEEKLEHELLAPCCYRETLDHHRSDAALTMNAEIHALVGQGKSEREILDLYKARYGMQIMAEPEGATWWVGTLVPFLMFAMGLALVVRLIKRWSFAI